LPIENYDEDEEIDVIEPIIPMKTNGMDDDMDDAMTKTTIDLRNADDTDYDDDDSDDSDYSQESEDDDDDDDDKD
jgi:hypothetical protein